MVRNLAADPGTVTLRLTTHTGPCPALLIQWSKEHMEEAETFYGIERIWNVGTYAQIQGSPYFPS